MFRRQYTSPIGVAPDQHWRRGNGSGLDGQFGDPGPGYRTAAPGNDPCGAVLQATLVALMLVAASCWWLLRGFDAPAAITQPQTVMPTPVGKSDLLPASAATDPNDDDADPSASYFDRMWKIFGPGRQRDTDADRDRANPAGRAAPPRIAALGNTGRQSIAPVGATRMPDAAPELAQEGEAQTSLVAFDTAPFPYNGKMPGSNRPFLDAGEPGHRGHTNFRGRVLWESETFNDPRVLLHIPPAYDPSRPGVMIVFFHGHGANLARDVRDRQQVPAQVTASGANAVLVAPQFAVNAADSSAGKFWDPGGFRRFLDEAAERLAELRGAPGTSRAFANMPIVIVAYSGGYGPTLSVLERGSLKSRLRGIVLLDALYNGTSQFANWIASDRSTFFVSSFTPHTERLNAELQQLIGNKAISYGTELRHHQLAGSITFLPTGNISHRDFVNRAWVESPLTDILVKLDAYNPGIEAAEAVPAPRPHLATGG